MFLRWILIGAEDEIGEPERFPSLWEDGCGGGFFRRKKTQNAQKLKLELGKGKPNLVLDLSLTL